MTEDVPVIKDLENQSQIPTIWRKTFERMVDAIKTGDFESLGAIEGVEPIKDEVATFMRQNIEDYGGTLAHLPSETWETSACQWMDGYWDVLVDLYTTEAGRSDLALAARVRERDGKYSFAINSVHVP